MGATNKVIDFLQFNSQEYFAFNVYFIYICTKPEKSFFLLYHYTAIFHIIAAP